MKGGRPLKALCVSVILLVISKALLGLLEQYLDAFSAWGGDRAQLEPSKKHRTTWGRMPANSTSLP